MRCFYCGKGVFDGAKILHRINPKGEKGVYACEKCIKPEQAQGLNPVVVDISERLAGIRTNCPGENDNAFCFDHPNCNKICLGTIADKKSMPV
ncbi:MAG: hypothetical protein LBU99_01765 [Spirochaetaceae bacterium]|jgi:hypothetical protein|nr:hypothetical protein [Spirochaetaceae bacterium]